MTFKTNTKFMVQGFGVWLETCRDRVGYEIADPIVLAIQSAIPQVFKPSTHLTPETIATIKEIIRRQNPTRHVLPNSYLDTISEGLFGKAST